MIKSAFIFLFIFVYCPGTSFAQHKDKVDSLCQLCNRAVSDTDKVVALNNLANYYYGNKLTREGDSVLNIQLRIAELSDNKNLVLKTYFDNSVANISSWSSSEDFNRTLQFIQKGIDYAKKVNDYNYTVIGYTRLAGVLRKRGNIDDAITAATTALFNLQQGVQDSLKAVAFIELGDCYQSKGESVLASRNYNNAFDIAIRSNNHYLESFIYHRLSDLYKYLGDMGEAKDYLVKSVDLNKKNKYGEGLIRDYIDLARLEDDPYYIALVLSLSDSLHLEKYKLRAKDILLAIYTVSQQDNKKALDYLHSQPELLDYYKQGGIYNYYFELGEIFRYGNQADSALLYFKKAEPEMLNNYDIDKTRYLYSEMAACYEMKKDRANAISYYEKSLGFCKQVRDLASIAGISNSLSILYKEGGDFENALSYKELATSSRDSLSLLAKNKDLTLLSVEREKRQHDEDQLKKGQAITKKRNIQYMFITVVICVVFVLMLVLGMFPISKLTIKVLGYFFFISLFEFIVLVLDNNVLHSITHGEPLTLWLIKIGLIGMLVPLQHFLEHTLIKFLESRKLLRARTNFSIKKWFQKRKVKILAKVKKDKTQKNKTKKGIEEMEEGTAVL